MFVKALVVGELQTNAYIAGCPRGKLAAVIDPGAEGELILREIASLGFELSCILLTHGHYDDIGGVSTLQRATGAPVMVHAADVPMLTDAAANLSQMLGFRYACGVPQRELRDNDIVEVGEFRLRVQHTPGHTPGSVCYVGPELVFSGDTLFAGSIGRTDFPGGSFRQLITSVKERLLQLPDETVVYPGHGPATTIGEERENNPFLTAQW
ncbi:MAG: MBL fold metallo-hydrolase [Firmicutes bacterium]|nr:MBL fold metallo-hydrolase [Bacillota bacterium]